MTLEIGIVTSVKYGSGGVICNVQSKERTQTQYTNCPVLRTFAGVNNPPKPGQRVLIGRLTDEKEVVVGVLSSEDGAPSDLSPGEYSISLDSGTKVTFTENGGSWDVNITASGKVYIDGTAFVDHTHDYTDNTTNGSTTRTTDPP